MRTLEKFRLNSNQTARFNQLSNSGAAHELIFFNLFYFAKKIKNIKSKNYENNPLRT